MRPGRSYRSIAQQPTDSYGPYSFLSRGHLSYFKQMLRLKYPGVVRIPQPARGVIVFPEQSAITDESTLTFDDGSNPPLVVGWDVAGDGVAGVDVEVDISGAVTAEDVRDEFAAAFLAAWGAGDIDIQATGGLIAGSNVLTFVQSAPGPDVQGWQAGGFQVNGADGNNPIVPSEPGEWTDRILGMDGGRDVEEGSALGLPIATGFRRAVLFGAGFDGGGGDE